MNLRDELLKVREEYGVLTPEVLKDAARPKSHPLHSRIFDKAPKDAAEAYYTQRAQELIRVVKIRFPTIDPGDKRTVRAFQAVRGTDQAYTYEPSEEVAADPFRRELVLREMEREWKQLKARYEAFVEFSEMVRRDLGEEAA